MPGNDFRCLAAAVFFCLLFCSGCGNSASSQNQTAIHAIHSDDSASGHYQPGGTTVLVPEAGGSVSVGSDPLLLDFSCSDQGYFMGKLTQKNKKINIQVTGPDDIIYKYFLEIPDVWTAFPLTAGDGAYLIMAFEEIENGQYASLFSYPLDLTLENEFLPFLYPNQYVRFTKDSEAVALAASLSEQAETDLDALRTIYDYVINHISYDDAKAASVQTGYLPDIDETLRSGAGICFDYAALMTAMLRALSIPTRLAIGYSGNIHHAWVDVYIESVGWVERIVEFNGSEWNFMDPTFASAGKGNAAIEEYIGDGTNYTLMYVR